MLLPTTDPVIQRHQRIAAALATSLDMTFRAYRTFDGKELTEGEVMSALGILIGQHCKSSDRVEAWSRAVSLSAVQTHAAKKIGNSHEK